MRTETQVDEFRSYPEAMFEVARDSVSYSPNIQIPAPVVEELDAISTPHLTKFNLALKRGSDLFVACIALAVFALPMLMIAALIKLTSKGSVFYEQERLTLNGRRFKMLKFRSMKENCETGGAVWAIKNDPRRTRFGSFLRASSLDELPQIWNVFRGDMSIVGPRPERPVFVATFRREIPHYDSRHVMKGGITGWAQVCGWRGNTSIEKRVQYDLFYVKNWSLRFDLKILFLTLFRGFVNKNAY